MKDAQRNGLISGGGAGCGSSATVASRKSSHECFLFFGGVPAQRAVNGQSNVRRLDERELNRPKPRREVMLMRYGDGGSREQTLCECM